MYPKMRLVKETTGEWKRRKERILMKHITSI
jgi:hypothetical protein